MAYTLKRRIKRYIITIYHCLSVDKLLMFCGYNNKKIKASIKKFYPKASAEDITLLVKDIKHCYYKYLTTPDEFFLFGFNKNTTPSYRSSFLTDNYKIRCLLKTISEEKYVNELCDKYNFFKIAKVYFNRGAIYVGPETTFDDFVSFTNEHKDLFIKPLSDSFGRGAKSVLIETQADVEREFKELKSCGTWIVEERIHQCEKTKMWNPSSVNTVRLPCLLSDGKFNVLGPFFRTGRKGSVVDNGGGGGIFACVDPKTGLVTSDGFDELGRYYEKHPDSGITYKGWMIPRWSELLIVAEGVFRECFPTHRYIGFDFALTEKGWVLIEGNWGQFIGQYNNKIGLKESFIEYIKE